MAQKRIKTANPGLMINARKEGLLCYHSSYILVKYLSKGHLIMSSSFKIDDLYLEALTVVFSNTGASIVSFGVVKVKVNALR
jgi:hypothetical protein